jgi:L-rhamnose mutarotase
MRALEDDPANRRWQQFINQHVDHFVSTAAGPEGMALGEVWRLQAQREQAQREQAQPGDSQTPTASTKAP